MEAMMPARKLHTVNRRRYPRIQCREVKACIKTEVEESSSVVVDLVNISRGGVCFTSFATFSPETRVWIATYYMEGGHKIYQFGRIILQLNASATLPGVYAIEFLRNSVSAP
jgi:hypothetical protein